MYSSRWHAFTEAGSMKKAFPFQVGRKDSHHWTSALASLLRLILWCSCLAFVLSVIKRRIKSLPAGTALAAKASFPMRESSRRYVVVLRVSQL